MSDPVRLVRNSELRDSDPTPGMRRMQAIGTGGMWSGLVHTEPHMVSGWHHHGDHETTIYVSSGALRMEFGPGGRDTLDAHAGDFLHVPRGAIHREGNPTDGVATLVVVRAGSGAPTVNVDGPEPETG